MTNPPGEFGHLDSAHSKKPASDVDNRKIVAIQTAAGDSYLSMLRETEKLTRLYCSKHGIEYRQFIGIKRGHYPWHACFNRIMILKEFIDSGYSGWIFYLDADAFVVDLEFDVRRLIAEYPGAMLISPGGSTGLRWDVNDGVFLIDLGTATGRRIATLWYEDFMRTSDNDLRGASEWQMVPSDQPRLHKILQEHEILLTEVTHVPREIFNNHQGRFIRQVLRSNVPTMKDRIEAIRSQVNTILSGKAETGEKAITHVIGGSVLASTQYGTDYATEFRRILQTYVKGARNYLEWGAGYTTKMIVEHIGANGADLFLTIDEHQKYLAEVVAPLTAPYLRAEARPLTGACVNDRDSDLNYATFPLSLKQKFDFIYIDGRRRLECALVASMLCHPETTVVLHDYRRARYQPISALYRIVEDGPQFWVMKAHNTILERIDEALPLIVQNMTSTKT